MKDNLSFKNIFKRETKLASYIVICLTIVVLSLSYAMFFKVEGNSKNQVVEAGDLVFTYENTSQTITSEGNSDCFMPMSADETSIYLGTCDYRLSVQNTGSLKGAYTLRLVANEENTIEANKIKVIVRKQEGEVFQIVSGYENGKTVSELTDGIIIEDEEMETNSTVVFSVSLIIDESVATEEDTSKVLSYKIEGTGLVHESQDIHTTPGYTEELLNGTDPVLEEPLIAVTIEADGTVKRADLTSEWYSYANKEWANAIILTDESQNSNYESGEVIPEEAIESYFVWIPKYRYQIWDLGEYEELTEIDESKVHEIPIVFGDYNTSDDVDGECTTPMESGATGNCTVGDYMTHPAFLSIPSTGFWVGKFETGTTLSSDYNVRDSDAIQIKPNVSSWRNIQAANAFYTSYDYKRDLDSHMMKNTEWGAVAYLQHSAYGSQESVRINNNSDYITGYAANNEPTCGYTATNEECNRYCNDGTCNTAYSNSVHASTTGNITGIYDMSGGAWEYVMGIMIDQNGKPMSGKNSLYNSGFNGTLGCPTCDSDTSGLTELTGGYDFPDRKYYDTYVYATAEEQFQRRILGDATGEMGPFANTTYLTQTRQISSWYADEAWFICSSAPWFLRGGFHTSGLDAGVFAFENDYGHTISTVSFRLVLTP